MNRPIQIRPGDLDLDFPEPTSPLLPHDQSGITWDQWMHECSERTNAYLKTYDRKNDPTLTVHQTRFVLDAN